MNCDNDIDIENTNNDFYCCVCVLMKTMLNSDESIIVIKQTNQMKLASGTWLQQFRPGIVAGNRILIITKDVRE